MRQTSATDWIFAGSFVLAATGFLAWLYFERQDAKVRMQDHQWFMDQVKVADMGRQFGND